MIRVGGPLHNAERERLMISHECNATLARRRLHFDEVVHDTGAFRPAIDVVAQKDEGGRPLVGVLPAARDQTAELPQRAMDVTNCESKHGASLPRVKMTAHIRASADRRWCCIPRRAKRQRGNSARPESPFLGRCEGVAVHQGDGRETVPLMSEPPQQGRGSRSPSARPRHG
jgi:hypothetical protein